MKKDILRGEDGAIKGIKEKLDKEDQLVGYMSTAKAAGTIDYVNKT